ncbi:MAG: hypothetical protein HY707_07255 [Ignavibacteriae bacterium]|nr:hypothetical protein [Ignavibacteriota bacterium]
MISMLTRWFSFVLSFLCCVVAFNNPTYTQSIILDNSRLFNAGARALGLAEAHVAEAYDVNSMYWNPASLSYLRQYSFVLDHALEVSSNLMNENISMPLYRTNEQVMAMGLTVNHIGYLREGVEANFRAVQYGYDVAYSQKLIPTVSIGARVGLRYGHTPSSNVWGVSSSVGIFYSPSQEISYGASFSGLGTGIRYSHNGISTALSTAKLSRRLQVGASLRYPSSLKQTIFIISVANEKIFDRAGIRYKGGIEFFPVHFIALRTGYLVDPEVKVAFYGLGIKAGRIRFEYAMSPSKLTNRLYQFSLGLDVWGKNSFD